MIKLADFGASKRLAEMVTTRWGHRSIKGTPYWIAEVIKQTGHGRQADIWSVGCTVLEMATGKPPWSEHGSQVSALFHIASSKSPPPIPEWMSRGERFPPPLLQPRVPKDRPNATRLLRHPFALVSPSAMPSPSNAVRPSSATSVASLRGDGYPEAPRDAPAPGDGSPDASLDDPSGESTDDTLASAPRTPARVVKDVERVGERPEDASKVADRRAAVYEVDDAEAMTRRGVTVSVSVFGRPKIARGGAFEIVRGGRGVAHGD